MKKSVLLKFALSVLVFTFLIFSCTKDNKDEIEETIEEIPYFSVTVDGHTKDFDIALAYYCKKNGKEFLRAVSNEELLDTATYDPPYAPNNIIAYYGNDGTNISNSMRLVVSEMNNGVLDTFLIIPNTGTVDIESSNDNYVKGTVVGTFESLNNEILNYSAEFTAQIVPGSFICN